MSIVDYLKRTEHARQLKARGGNQQTQHNPSGHGKGKWHSKAVLARYRKARDKANAVAADSRARNRAA